jgi:hypothetical protein
MTIRRVAVALTTTVLLSVLLTGCGAAADPGAGGPSSGSSASSAPSSVGPSAPSSAPSAAAPSGSSAADVVPIPDLTGKPPKPGTGEATTTVSGTVVAGVEAGCLLLRTGATDYLLLIGAGAGAVKAGDKVRATGTVDTGRMTTCQQGTPLVVTRIQPG